MKPSLPRISFDLPPQRKLGLLLALPFLIFALWCGWSAWQQHQAKSLDTEAQKARESIAQIANTLVSKEQKALEQHASAPAVATAAAAGDWAAATQALSQGWKDAKDVEAFGLDLGDEYEDATTDFARLAVLEAVSLQEKPASALVRNGKAYDLALGTPLRAGDRLVGIAYGHVPMKSLVDAISKADIDSSSYLALRQGAFSVIEAGDKSLADTADRQVTPIKSSNLRLVSSSVEAAPGPFGLEGMSLWIATLVGFGLAVLAGTAPKWIHKVKRGKKAAPKAIEDDELPLSALMANRENSPLVRPAHTPANAPVIDTDFTLSPQAKALLSEDPFGSEGINSDEGSYIVLGLVLGGWLSSRGINQIALGGEGQGASVKVKDGLVEGLSQAGLQVAPIDQAPHPFVLFAASQLRAGAALTLEELRTVPTRTQLRLFIEGMPLTSDEADMLRNYLSKGQIPKAEGGATEHHEVEAEYKRKLAEEINLARPVRIKVQGEHSELAGRILDALGAHVATDDQEFEVVLSLTDHGTALAVANGSGVKVQPARLLTLLALDLLQRNPGADVVCDEESSSALSGEVLSMGGVLKIADPGVESLQAKVAQTKAVLGGDAQGHINFADHAHAMPDAIYAAARFLEIVANAYHADDVLES